MPNTTQPKDVTYGQFPPGVVVEEQPMSVREVTFVAGAEMPGHRWYKLRPSFAPQLVESIYETNGRGATSIVDPYSGAGTTVLTAKALGLHGVGIELNPFLAELTMRATDWSTPPDELMSAGRKVTKEFLARAKSVAGMSLEAAEDALGVPRPTIHNVLRWWRPDVLSVLLAFKAVMNEQPADSTEHRIAWIVLSTACIEVANIKRLHPTLSFFDRSEETIDTQGILVEKVQTVVEDLSSVYLPSAPSTAIYSGDCSDSSMYKDLTSPVALITSPPYANRYSYVWETRPHLYMMDLIQETKEAGALDLAAPGGTWGVATSSLQKDVIPAEFDSIGLVLGRQLAALDANNPLMANYVRRYFNMMGKQLTTVGNVLPSGSTISYVVGNSRISGEEIDTQGCLAHLMEETGLLRPTRCVVFRRRIGRKDLFEVTLMADVI